MVNCFNIVLCQYSAWILLLHVSLVSPSMKVCHASMTQKEGICGNGLADIMKMICSDQGYNGFKKRSSDVSTGIVNSPFLPKNVALRVLKKKRNVGIGGIVCECCVHQCTMEEMNEYCAVPTVKRSQTSVGAGQVTLHTGRNQRGKELAQISKYLTALHDSSHAQELERPSTGDFDSIKLNIDPNDLGFLEEKLDDSERDYDQSPDSSSSSLGWLSLNKL